MIFNLFRAYIKEKQKDFSQWSFINLFPMCHNIVLNIIYICVCAIFVDIIIFVLFVGRGQSISCDNVLSNPFAVYLE